MNKFVTVEKVNTLCGFFTQYKERKPEHFLELFGETTETDTTELDNLLIDVFGHRVFTSRYETIFNASGATALQNRLISSCDRMFFENWLSVKKTIKKVLETDIEKPIKETKTRTLESSKESESETQNKENAFDDVQNASNTDSSNTSGSGSENVEEVTSWARSNNRTAIENGAGLLDFVKLNYFINIVLYNVINFATILIC